MQGQQNLLERVRDAETNDPARDAKHQAFDEELAQQAGAGDTKGEPHSDFAGTSERTRDEHAGNIETRNQQENRRGGQQEQERPSYVANNLFVQWNDHGAAPGVHPRKRCFETPGNRRGLQLGAGNRNTRGQPRDCHHEWRASVPHHG